MKFINFFLVASAISVDVVYAGNTMSIEDAAKKGLVKLTIKGKGGYTGKVIEMKVQNLSNESLCLKVETGRRFDSKIDTQQDILVTKEENMMLAAKQQKTCDVFGMCCQANNSSPAANSIFNVGKMADSSLIKLAMFIDKNNYHTDYSAQQAVWSVSDNNSIGSIDGAKDEDVKKLRNYVSQLTGRPIPLYNVHYKQQDDMSVAGRVVNIDGVFKYELNIDNKVTIAIYNSEGKIVQLLIQNQPHEDGEYKLFYTFNTSKLPSGTYYARMSTDGAVVKEEKIDF
ncbi:MAG: hypothetical protein K0S44_3189 [Bacteroidetes bacterium]|jgi:hypothetical protein|nr:hypothetical protein [Bacteroidota bacterium]